MGWIALQVLLLVLWYIVPAMATVPAIVIFIPMIAWAIVWFFVLLIAGAASSR